MTRPEVAVLVNAAAGRGRAARAVPAVVAALTAGGVRPRVLAAAALAADLHVDHPAVTVLRGREIGLTGAGLTTWAGGEPICALPATTVCVPGALTVLGAAPPHHQNGHVGDEGGRTVARAESA